MEKAELMIAKMIDNGKARFVKRTVTMKLYPYEIAKISERLVCEYLKSEFHWSETDIQNNKSFIQKTIDDTGTRSGDYYFHRD